jgi:bacteriocin-like protein
VTIENMIQSWKSEEEMDTEVANPAGEELSDQELQEIAGGMICTYTCANGWTCVDWTGSL